MNKQEAYNRVCEHLMTQKKQARETENGICRYRTSDGLKCAIGCLIPDEVYVPEMEGKTVGQLVNRYPNLFGEELFPLLRDLQMVHDADPIESWPERLASIGRKHSLEVYVEQARSL